MLHLFHDQTLIKSCLQLAAAILAGMFNGIAGGGSFISFPVLVSTGLSPVSANATSTLALWFGAFASTIAYRHALQGKALQGKTKAASSPTQKPSQPSNATGIDRAYLYALVGSSLLGGIVGSCLLLISSDQVFSLIVPYLMVLATLLFAFGPTIKKWLAKNNKVQLPIIAALLLQFVIAIYGGYFGGGVSILMLAAMNFMGFTNVHTMNGLKSLLGNCMNGVAIVAFVIAQKIAWFPAILMAFGAILGAYISAQIAQKIPEKIVRNFIIGIACTMTVYLFFKQWKIV